MKLRMVIYWIFQLGSWTFFYLVLLFFNYIQNTFDENTIVNNLPFLIIGVGATHLYWLVLRKLNWKSVSLLGLLPRIVLSAIIYSLCMSLLIALTYDLLFPKVGAFFIWPFKGIWVFLINFSIIGLIWTALYFGLHFFENYRNEEIKNLKLQASNTEIELYNLKSQLNPHFMFNALNSIRALVSEDPIEAKKSITKLSTMLRNSLLLGRKKLIPLEEEIQLVNDYLSLEKIRYEERLEIFYDFESDALKCLIPPLMLQTIVENAIKHGISTLPDGGKLRIESELMEEHLLIRVENSGKLIEKESDRVPIGIKNTKRRLRLLFDKKAQFSLTQHTKNSVLATIKIPKRYEDINR